MRPVQQWYIHPPESPLDYNPFSTAVLFWGQLTQILSSLSPKWNCSLKKGYDVRADKTTR